MRRLCCALFVGALVVGGCGGEDPPAPVPTSVATTSANPGATLPPMPEQASEDSPEGASNFARHYVDVLGYAANTGDLDELQRLSDPDCDGCNRYLDFFHDVYEAGGFIRQRWSVSGDMLTRLNDEPDTESYVTIEIQISEGSHRKSSDAEESNTAASTDKVTLALRHEDGWVATQLWPGDYK